MRHLIAASSGPNRITEIEAAVTKDGRILALKLDQLEDYGAFLHAPMPGPLYRMQGSQSPAFMTFPALLSDDPPNDPRQLWSDSLSFGRFPSKML